MENPPSENETTPVSKLKCDHCDKSFGRRKNLNQHIARIHKAQRYKCNVCDALLSSGFRLKHLSSIHKKKQISNLSKVNWLLQRTKGMKHYLKRKSISFANKLPTFGNWKSKLQNRRLSSKISGKRSQVDPAINDLFAQAFFFVSIL